MFQSAMLLNSSYNSDIFLPFSVNEINIYSNINNGKRIICEKISDNKKIDFYNIYMVDDSNQLICEFKCYSGVKKK